MKAHHVATASSPILGGNSSDPESSSVVKSESKPSSPPVTDIFMRVLEEVRSLDRSNFSKASPDNQKAFVEDSLLDLMATNPLESFEKSSDLNHLESILRVIENPQFDASGGENFSTLSRHFEALSVYKGTLTDSHWNLEEDKPVLSIWSMLSYFNHCVERFSPVYPDLLRLLKEKLVMAFQRDKGLFRQIFEYEELKEKREYLIFKQLDMKIQKYYEIQWEQPALKDDINLWGLSGISNFPECSQLSSIKKRRFLSNKKKRQLAEQLWSGLASEESIRCKVFGSEKIVEVDRSIQFIEDQMIAKKIDIDKISKNASLNFVKRVLQCLYEFEQLQIVLDCTKDVFASAPLDQSVYIQWLVNLREGLRLVMKDLDLNIPGVRSLHLFSENIKKIRDYFEHPEDYVLRLDNPNKEKKEIPENLTRDLFEQLAQMIPDLRAAIECRLDGLKKILRPHPQKSVEDVLKLMGDEKKQKEDFSKHRKLKFEEYPSIQDFSDRIVDKEKYDEKTVEEQGSFYVPFASNESSEKVLQKFQSSCDSLRDLIKGSSRFDIEERINRDVVFRLKIQRGISDSHRLLENYLKKISTSFSEEIDGELYLFLEEIYFAARDVRNFQTHDLWRSNDLGIIDTAYLFAFDCSEKSLTMRIASQSNEEEALLEEILQKVRKGTLSQKELETKVAAGFELDSCDSKARSLLHFLAEDPSEKNLSLFQFIFSEGGNIHRADCMWMRPLHYAARSGFVALAQFLIEQGAVLGIASKEGTALEIAQRCEHTELAQLLLQKMGVKRSSNAKALLEAVNNLDEQSVLALIKDGFDPMADYEGKFPLVALFEKESVDCERQTAVARHLIGAGAKIDQQEPGSGQTALHTAAAFTDQDKIINFLLQNDPKVNIQDDQKSTPLHLAVSALHKEWVRALLNANAQVDLRDSFGDTPLLIACNRVRPPVEIIKSLVEAGADIEAEILMEKSFII